MVLAAAGLGKWRLPMEAQIRKAAENDLRLCCTSLPQQDILANGAFNMKFQMETRHSYKSVRIIDGSVGSWHGCIDDHNEHLQHRCKQLVPRVVVVGCVWQRELAYKVVVVLIVVASVAAACLCLCACV